jgi:hypothetical protein
MSDHHIRERDGSEAADLTRLSQLEAEERTISSRRRRVQDRIDFVRSGRAIDSPDAIAQLERLLEEEGDLSSRRRELHAEIDIVRKRLGQRPGPTPRRKLIGG